VCNPTSLSHPRRKSLVQSIDDNCHYLIDPRTSRLVCARALNLSTSYIYTNPRRKTRNVGPRILPRRSTPVPAAKVRLHTSLTTYFATVLTRNSYGPPQGQYAQGPPMQYGAPPPQQQMYYGPPQGQQYQQAPPPKQKKDRGCLTACLATLCCCFVCEEGCECCADCCECAEDCC
jgi:hypothetical protein